DGIRVFHVTGVQTCALPILTKLPEDPWRDEEWMDRVHKVEDDYHDLLDRLPPARRADPEVTEIRWMIEELRVSFFAQTIGTPTQIGRASWRERGELREGSGA